MNVKCRLVSLKKEYMKIKKRIPEKQLHSDIKYQPFFLTLTVNIITLQRTLTFDEDKRQIKIKKKKKLPPKLVPAPPEAVYYRMG